MVKGIALQFKQAFPDNFKTYQRECRAGRVKPGRMLVVDTGSLIDPREDKILEAMTKKEKLCRCF